MIELWNYLNTRQKAGVVVAFIIFFSFLMIIALIRLHNSALLQSKSVCLADTAHRF